MENYTKPTVRDLGSVADLTQATQSGTVSDDVLLTLPGGGTVIGTIGALSGDAADA